MQLGFYFDQTRCTNCMACVVACKDWHDIPAGPVSYRRIISIEEGIYPDLSASFLSIACHHCVDAPCIRGCPSDAISKREEDGIVIVNRDECIGFDNCGNCQNVCPYVAPQFGAEPDSKMQKCNMCLERWGEGKKPVCVEACPMRALDAGPLEELASKYKITKEAKGFTIYKGTKPSILFKAMEKWR